MHTEMCSINKNLNSLLKHFKSFKTCGPELSNGKLNFFNYYFRPPKANYCQTRRLLFVLLRTSLAAGPHLLIAVFLLLTFIIELKHCTLTSYRINVTPVWSIFWSSMFCFLWMLRSHLIQEHEFHQRMCQERIFVI